MFLAVSPEEKESWVNALSIAIIKAKNRVLDEVRAAFFHGFKCFNNTSATFFNRVLTQFVCVQVTIEEDSTLVHPTRDRAKIPYGRRLPTKGHLMAVVLGAFFPSVLWSEC